MLRAHRLPAGLCLGLALALGTHEACAAAAGSLATSAGLFAALAALVLMKTGPANFPTATLSTAGGALALVGCAAWWWRGRGTVRWPKAPMGSRALTGLGWRGSARRATGCFETRVDRHRLLVELRAQFMRLQRAWDGGDLAAMRSLTTGAMLEELLVERQFAAASGPTEGRGATEVVSLRAELLCCEAIADDYLVSVQFSGLMRESSGAAAQPFREVWMLTQPKADGSGWRLARHQTLL